MLIKEGKTNWKYILIIVILAAIIGGGILTWQYFETREETKLPEEKTSEETAKDETADWKTYRNEEYGYEVKYPTDSWKLGKFGRDFRKGEREFDVLHTKLFQQAEQVEAGETIRWNEPMAFIGWNKGPVNGEDWKTYSLKDWLNTWCNEKFEEGSIKKVGFNNEYEAAQCEQDVICEFGYCHSSLSILIQQPNTSTKLLFWVTVAETFTAEEIRRNKETYFPIYQRILSTFKFIEVDETADWQTYRNEEYGYEVKYPTDYIANIDNPTRVYFEPSEFVFIEGPFPTIEIINKSPEEQKESLKQQYLTSESPFAKIIEREDIIVNNLRGKDMIFMAETGVETRYILLSYKGKTYQLNAAYILKIQTIFNQILSTFKFIEVEDIEDVETDCGEWRKECAGEGGVFCTVCGCRNCCSGLVSRYVTHPMRNKANEVVCVENMTVARCVKCGDGICGESEDWCICPEDCNKPNSEDLELHPL